VRMNLLGAGIDAVDINEAEEQIADFVSSGNPHQVMTLNPEILYKAQKESELMDLINGASLVTADGIGIVWGLRLKGEPVRGRVTGIDLMLRLIARSEKEGWRVFFLGGAPGVAEEAAGRLKKIHPQLKVAGVCHGFFEIAGNGRERSDKGRENASVSSLKEQQDRPDLREEEVVAMVRRARPHLLFVGMGSPKQDKLIARNLNSFKVPVAIGVGGSFDVAAGKVRRAPIWMQRLHMEWAGRLVYEPRRWRRMLILPRFACMVLRGMLNPRS